MEPMTKEAYEAELKKLEEQFSKEKIKLIKKCAASNNLYKKGDIISDHVGAIKIESIGVYYSTIGMPQCTYTGLELKKDGAPTKKMTTRTVYQQNIITK